MLGVIKSYPADNLSSKTTKNKKISCRLGFKPGEVAIKLREALGCGLNFFYIGKSFTVGCSFQIRINEDVYPAEN